MRLNKFFKSVALMCAVCLSTGLVYADGVAETEFSENFNSFKISHISYDGDSLNSIINNGTPVDGDYSNTAVYPNGEESVYEGNAANNLYVYDSKGNKVYGGIDGWVGFYKGSNSTYNKYNRRLTIRNDGKFSANNVLGFEPSKGSVGAYSVFAKENVDLSGISVWESDVAVATPGSGTADEYSIFNLSITKNPRQAETDYEYDVSIPLVQFATKDQAANSLAEIRIFGEKVADIKVISMYSSNKMYTVKYVLDNSGEVPLHWVTIKDGNTVIGSSAPQVVEGYEQFFEDGATYGIMYRADPVNEKIDPRYLLDNIKFSKGTSVNITNAEEIANTKYPLLNAEIDIEIDSNITGSVDGCVTLTDEKGEVVSVQVTKSGNVLKVKANELQPQSMYTVNLKNVGYGDGMYFNKTLEIKTEGRAKITEVTKSTNSAQIKVKNNCSDEKTFVVLLTANKDNLTVSGGVYYKAVPVGAGQTATVDISDITLDGLQLSNVKLNAYVIDSFGLMRSVADKYEF